MPISNTRCPAWTSRISSMRSMRSGLVLEEVARPSASISVTSVVGE
ncbi:MAG: hypothetical protein ACR2GE_03360 [Pseudonocardia sp.]